MALDLAGLKLILAQEMSFSRHWRIPLPPATDDAVTVRSSIKALIGSCSIPDLDKGPLHSFSAILTSIFMAKVKRITEMVCLIIPFSSWCQSDATFPEVTLSLSSCFSSGWDPWSYWVQWRSVCAHAHTYWQLLTYRDKRWCIVHTETFRSTETCCKHCPHLFLLK